MIGENSWRDRLEDVGNGVADGRTEREEVSREFQENFGRKKSNALNGF